MKLKLLDGLGRERNIHLSDFTTVPSVGHRVKMGYTEAPIVTDVIWDYKLEKGDTGEAEVTIFMNDINSLPRDIHNSLPK